MAGFCVLSSQALVQYGLLKHDGSIETKNSPNLQAFGISNEKKSDASRGEGGAIVKVGNMILNIDDIVILSEDNFYDGCGYELDDEKKEAKLRYCSVSKMEVKIPKCLVKNHTIYIVTSIGNYTFSGCSSLKRLEIPQTVTSIGDYDFNGCRILESIYIPRNAPYKRNLIAIGLEDKIKYLDNAENNASEE